jgi:hypothetical protein
VPSPRRRPFVRLGVRFDLLLREFSSGTTATIDSFARGMDRPVDRGRRVSRRGKRVVLRERKS